MLPFRGHNVVLDDGTQTAPHLPELAGTGICQAALRMLRLCFGDVRGYGIRVADLGCFEGGYAVALARAGYQVTGVEARAGNYAKCAEVAAACPSLAGRLRFVRGDARDLASLGEFDAVLCAGLLYHVDRPGEFLAMLGKVTRRLLILQTHICGEPEGVSAEGLPGRPYGDATGEDNPFGSWGNSESWWLTLPALLGAVRDAGFPLVLQQFDYLPDIAAGPQGSPCAETPEGGTDRVMVCGVKP